MAEEKPKARKKTRPVINNARIIRMSRGDFSYPAVIFEGSAPDKGAKVDVSFDNGVNYTGTVYDATESAGEVLVEFTNGLTPTNKP